MKISSLLLSFNAGEFGTLLDRRVDLDKHLSAARQMQNFFATVYGAAFKRPGLEYINSAKNAGKKCRMIGFEHSVEQSYMLEFGDLYIRFFMDGGRILDGEGPYEIVSPYAEADLFDIHKVQSADVMTIFHGDYATRNLSRTGHTSWTLEEIDFVGGPFLERNDTAITITPSATTGTITLAASANVFEADHVGAYWQIVHDRTDNPLTGSFTAVGQSASIPCDTNWDFYTQGTWTGTVRIERSYDSGSTWQPYKTVVSKDNKNAVESGEEQEAEVLYRIACTAFTSGTCEYTFTVYDNEHAGEVKITGFTDAQTVTATVKKDLIATGATTKWAEGAWSPKRGYPSTGWYYENRRWYAGTKYQPHRRWGSDIGDYNKFSVGSRDTDALIVDLNSDKVNAIKWGVGQNSMLIGTKGGEWKHGEASNDPVTPTNPKQARRQSTKGSADIQGLMVDDVVMYVQRGRRKVREMAYEFDKDGYVSPDLTRLAPHITKSGIAGIAYQSQPIPLLWCWLENGKAGVLTYERADNVVAWTPFVTDGYVESIDVIPSDEGTSEDEVWMSVKRVVNGSAVRYIERLKPHDFGDDQRDCFYVDAGLTYDGEAVTEISGLDHLEGETVQVLADGAVDNEMTVSDGKITLSRAASKVHAGLKYEAKLKPMRIDLALQSGSTMADKKVITVITFFFYQTLGVKYGPSVTELTEMDFRRVEDAMDTAVPLFTGDKQVTFEGGYDTSADIIVVSDKPLPCTTQAIAVDLELV